jgi:hypothetical protein
MMRAQKCPVAKSAGTWLEVICMASPCFAPPFCVKPRLTARALA